MNQTPPSPILWEEKKDLLSTAQRLGSGLGLDRLLENISYMGQQARFPQDFQPNPVRISKQTLKRFLDHGLVIDFSPSFFKAIDA